MTTLEIISKTHPNIVHSVEKLTNYQLEALVVETIKRLATTIDPLLNTSGLRKWGRKKAYGSRNSKRPELHMHYQR